VTSSSAAASRIKILSVQHPELTRRFLIEARATARCHHENIVVIYEVGQVGDQPYMVLEYLKGHAADRPHLRGPPLPPARAVELMLPVLRALIVAHARASFTATSSPTTSS
jgi:serine/threonine protein kinase